MTLVRVSAAAGVGGAAVDVAESVRRVFGVLPGRAARPVHGADAQQPHLAADPPQRPRARRRAGENRAIVLYCIVILWTIHIYRGDFN